MNTQNLLIHCPAKPGFNRIFDVGEYNMHSVMWWFRM